MQQPTHPAPAVVLTVKAAEELTPAQLRGERCWRELDCDGPYLPVGHAYTAPSEPGAPLGWPIVACPNHGGEERFHVQIMGDDDPHPGMWGVWDRGRWAEAGGEPDYYPDRHGAEQARHRLRAMYRVA